MREKTKTIYECEKCGTGYNSQQEALKCESKPITHDLGLKKGDKVIITVGDGKGEIATVDMTYVISKDWGHYAWERYWHTVGVQASIDDGFGTRSLTFDCYELIKR